MVNACVSIRGLVVRNSFDGLCLRPCFEVPVHCRRWGHEDARHMGTEGPGELAKN